jgi:hypothetical protein
MIEMCTGDTVMVACQTSVVAENLTRPTDEDVDEVIDALPDERRREESRTMCAMMRELTGSPPVMWGSTIVGFGSYRSTYASGRSGEWFVVGFAPRKARMTIYLMDGFEERGDLLERLGPHSNGKSCLHITRLERVELDVLRELVAASVATVRGAT